MLPLFQIADQYRIILSQADDIDELEPEAADSLKQSVIDTLEALNLDDQFTDKALAVAAFTREIEAEAAAVKDTENALKSRRKRLENRALFMRDYLLIQMQKVGKVELKNHQLLVKVRKCPPRILVESETMIPDEFKEVEILTKVCKAKMLEYFRSGAVTDIPGVQLDTSGLSLSIR